MGSDKGGDRDAGSPFRFFCRSPGDDFIELKASRNAVLERCVPVLETERLVLRAPRLADVKAIARLVNDRRIAENTARIPHPYGVDDAEQFLDRGQSAETAKRPSPSC